MKPLQYIFFCISLGLLFLFQSCSEEFEPKPLTYSQLLSGDSSKTWRLSGIILLEENKEPVSFQISNPNNPNDPNFCEYDELYTFYANAGRSFEINRGDNICSNEAEIYFTDTWSVINANSTLNFATPIFGYTGYTIQRLTERNMVLELFDRQNNYSYRLTFTALRD